MALTMSDLNDEGAIPEIREELMASAIVGLIQLMRVQSRDTGMELIGDVERLLVLTHFTTSDVVHDIARHVA